MSENQKSEQLKDLDELLDRYDKLRSLANNASFDKRITTKWKFIKPATEMEWFKKFQKIAYDLPFASKHIRREMRITLRNVANLHEMNYLRTERSDKNSKKAIDIITEYLEEIPRGPSLTTRLKNDSIAIFGIVSGFLPIIAPNLSGELNLGWIALGITITLLFAVPYLSNRIVGYLLERDLYTHWMKRLAIRDLKEKIIDELIDLNDETYDELERKFSSS